MNMNELKLPSKIDVAAEMARRSLVGFAKINQPNFVLSDFHSSYYAVLELFGEYINEFMQVDTIVTEISRSGKVPSGAKHIN